MATTSGVATASLYDVLTLPQAAAYLQLPEADVRTEAEAGRLIGRAVGDDWRFVRDELIRWVKPLRLPSASPAWSAETEAACEAEIAAIYAARKTLGTVGDHFPAAEG
jgi:hypothetical protein